MISKLRDFCNNSKLSSMEQIVNYEESILQSELSKSYYQGKIDLINDMYTILEDIEE